MAVGGSLLENISRTCLTKFKMYGGNNKTASLRSKGYKTVDVKVKGISESVSSTIDYPFPSVKTLHSVQLTSSLRDAGYPEGKNLE